VTFAVLLVDCDRGVLVLGREASNPRSRGTQVYDLGETDPFADADNAIAKREAAEMSVTQANALKGMKNAVEDAKRLAAEAAQRTTPTSLPKGPTWPFGSVSPSKGKGSGGGSGGRTGGNATKAAARDWWNARMPPGEGSARAEASARMNTALSEVQASRKREVAADNDEKERLLKTVEYENMRQSELLNETTMNSTGNEWGNLKKWQPQNKSDHDVRKGYLPPAMPPEWEAIYGPNSTSYINGSEMHIAFDTESYPKPWANANNTANSSNSSQELGSGLLDATTQTLSISEMQSQFNKDLKEIDISNLRLQSSDQQSENQQPTNPSQMHATRESNRRDDYTVQVLDDHWEDSLIGGVHVQVGQPIQ